MGTLHRKHWNIILDGVDPKPGVYIETGLWKGNSLAIAAEVFDECHGIELAPHWAEHNRRRFQDEPGITIHEGDSAVLLPEILDSLEFKDVVIMLDAHFCKTDPPIAKSKFPLWTELAQIEQRPTGDIVIVDDVHTFNRPRPDLRYKPGAVEWEAVTPAELVERLGPARVEKHRAVGDSYVIWRQPIF